MRCKRFALPTSLVVVLALSVAQAGPKYADPNNTDADFPLQGEYLVDGDVKLGVQVIARGKGKFEAVAYPGGLPGAGAEVKAKKPLAGTAVDGELKLASKDNSITATVKAGTISVTHGDKTLSGKKVQRQSPTIGLKPPANAVVLFDGTSVKHFQQGARMTDDGLLMEGANSSGKFGSCTLHLEFRLPYQPEDSGQGRGNSGCYLQSRYEVQILDSFGLEGKNNECGGIYTIKDTDVNMCLPPLVWQTYDIEYTAAEFADEKKVKNARITVKHNGVIVQNNVELTHATTAAPLKEGPEPGPLHLQNHSEPVRFRNIWILEKK